jgi:anhydro-N-acetylmuramic acid kinase
MRVIGLMSGTSADGVDAALVEVTWADGRLRANPLATTNTPFAADLRSEILAVCDPATGTVDRICRLNARLGDIFARAAALVSEVAGISLADVDLIGSHGQTIYHAVGPGANPPSTLQIGEPSVIAERTGCTVVANFRSRDVAAGGQGAPLVSYVDYLLFSDPDRTRALQNIGGIANVTLLPAGGAASDIVAFDTGPGNMVIDALTEQYFDQPFDRDGLIAAAGQVHEGVLLELLRDSFFSDPPPKTTGRELFGRQFASRLGVLGQEFGLAPADLVATATALTARSIADAYLHFLPPIDDVFVSGGGAANPVLMSWLASSFRGLGIEASVRRSDDIGMSSDAKEAIAFAVLAYETVHGRTATLPRSTGADHPSVLGVIAPGRNFRSLMAATVLAPATARRVP